MKCDTCIWLMEINEVQALCPFSSCVKENGWKVDEEGVNKDVYTRKNGAVRRK